MEEKIGLPIKYGVLPIIRQGDESIIGYIVSKAYLLGEEIIYFEQRRAEQTYKMLFPYTNYFDFCDELLDKNMLSNRTLIVRNVFHIYEDAKKEADFQNDILKKNGLSDETIFMDLQRFEEQIKELTNFMQVENDTVTRKRFKVD